MLTMRESIAQTDSALSFSGGGHRMFDLVRHAHAVEKKKWQGVDTRRPLSSLGRMQAASIVAALDGIELHTLFSSPTVRCRKTLEPLASARKLQIQDHWLLAPDAPIDQLYSALCGEHIEGTLWCTHGEVLDDLDALAVERDGTSALPTAKTAKGGVWIVGRNTDPRYIEPNPTH